MGEASFGEHGGCRIGHHHLPHLRQRRRHLTRPRTPPAVWDAGFMGVWHLEEDVIDEANGGTHVDSTSNGNDGAQNGNVEATGEIADGQVVRRGRTTT